MEVDSTYQSMTQIDENIVVIAALNLNGMNLLKIMINNTTNQVALLLWR